MLKFNDWARRRNCVALAGRVDISPDGCRAVDGWVREPIHQSRRYANSSQLPDGELFGSVGTFT
ncbi:hypothetical protein K239x_57230 [Planctomycetes bacterium K23_9]|uniref:Uncharacterized protein n=1 Tax=Stieleria marina TaxID=1930275 RepID=A0A517P2W2_9BACT|nr:hypothetical protein K239x_57230 [Planctomycetes bacterium K23_9]